MNTYLGLVAGPEMYLRQKLSGEFVVDARPHHDDKDHHEDEENYPKDSLIEKIQLALHFK